MATVSIYVNQEQAAFVVRELNEAVQVMGYPQPGVMLYVDKDIYSAMQLAVEMLGEAKEK